jgi:hypothetical protein
MRRQLLVLTLAASMSPLALPAQQRAPLTNREIGDITTLLSLEDHRRFDSVALGRMLRDRHPEVGAEQRFRLAGS